MNHLILEFSSKERESANVCANYLPAYLQERHTHTFNVHVQTCSDGFTLDEAIQSSV